MRPLLLSLLIINLLYSEDIILPDIKVTSSIEEEGDDQDDLIVQKEGFMPKAPMQQQMTTKQALQTAGSNGDPIKALSSLAGIVSTNNDSGAEIYIHGSKPRETQFSLNHLPLGYVFHMGGLHSVIAPEATAQIDAYLGGFDTTYSAMGAVVDITPKYPVGSNSGRVHLGLYDADFAYDVKLGENTSLFLGGRRSYFDFIADDIMDELEKDEDDDSKKTTFTLFPQYYDAQMILSHTAGDHIFSLEAITSEDKMKLNTTMNKSKDPVANGKINTKIGFTTVGARWNYSGDSFESMTLLSQLKYKEDVEFFDEGFFSDTTYTDNRLYHETIFDTKDHTPLVGFELREITVPFKAKFFTNFSGDDFTPLISDQEIASADKTYSAKIYTGFAQDIWDISDDNHFRYGLRAWKTDFQDFTGGVDPRFAFVHDFDKTLSASVAIGKYSQFPEFIYLTKEFGNPLIDTSESSMHYAFNVSKKFEDKSSITVEPYFKSFEDLAITDEVKMYESVGKGEAYGVDITYKKNIDNLDLLLAYTFVKSKRQLNTNSNKQYRFQGDIPNTIQLNTTYRFANDWRVSSLFRYNDGRTYTPIIDTEEADGGYTRPIYGKPYSKRMPSNYDLDIQVGKTFKYSDSSLELAIELMNVNALFRKNIDSYEYTDEYERDGEIEQMGFLPALHLNYRF